MSAQAIAVARIRRIPVARVLTWQGAFVTLGVAAGIALRAWDYGAALGAPDSDEAAVGLMIRHFLHGELSVFYWGQVYGGTQEMFLGVPLFAIFGTGLLQLRVVSMTLSAVAAVLVWRVGKRTIGDRAAVAAGLLFWIWPPYMILHLTREYGFYASDVVYCALLLLLLLRIVEEPSRTRVTVFGLALGLSFWETAQIIPIALPAIAWTVWRRPKALRHLPFALAAAVVGALPWIVWNARHDWASVLPRSDLHQYVHGLRIFVSPLLPMLLGLRAPLTAQLLLPKALVYLVYVLLLGAFAVAAWRMRRQNAGLLYVVAAAFPFVWAVSRRATQTNSHPVFLIVIAPVLALIVAHVASTYLRGAVVVAACLAVSVVSLHRMDVWLAADRPHWPLTTPRDLTPLISTLERLHVSRIYADYWIAYRVSFDSHERIVATRNGFETPGTVTGGKVRPVPDPHPFYEPYENTVETAPRYGIVLFRDQVATAPIVPQLRAHGYRAYPVGPFVVFAQPQSGSQS